jgi:cell division protein ZapA (FtsZ GTPase activity inhibitor)
MVVEVSIGKSSYKINCNEKEREKVLHYAARLNQRVNELSLSLGQGSDEKDILAIAGLMMEEEIERLEEEKVVAENVAQAHKQKNQQSLSEKDIYDAVSENMENVADYVEQLTKKIQNY